MVERGCSNVVPTNAIESAIEECHDLSIVILLIYFQSDPL